MVDLPEAATVTEVAEALRLHPQTIRQMIRDGRLRAVRSGRAVRIPTTEIARFLAPDAEETP